MVLAYRKIHGKYNDIEALKKVEQVDVDLVNRLAPYLSFSD
jgi:DNA uptake protein ComE-like DNA-binding protein